MIRLLVWLVGSLAVLVALVALIGALLPVEHTASQTAIVPRSPDEVYATVRDVVRYPDWWPDVSRVEMLDPVDGRPRFRQHGANGTIVMVIVEDVPSRRLVTRIADPDQPFGGTWTFEIEGHPDGSRLTLTERGEVYNPIFRFLSRFVFGHTGTMESFLAALGRT